MEMLKIASSGLGMAPAQAMRTAEGLYTSGYISYPRTGTAPSATLNPSALHAFTDLPCSKPLIEYGLLQRAVPTLLASTSRRCWWR